MKKKSFALGYSFIAHSAFMYMMFAIICSGGTQFIVKAYAEKTGLEYSILMSLNAVGGICACIFMWFIGRIIARSGVRYVTSISLILGALGGMFLLRVTDSYVGWAISTIFAQCTAQGYCFTATNTLITSWWPKKKGFVMGITTCGIMLITFTYIPAMAKMDIDGIANLVGGSMLLLGITSFFWIRETPASCGLYPDNMEPTPEELAAIEAAKNEPKYVSTWSAKTLFRRKEAWLLLFYGGAGQLVASGSAASSMKLFYEYSGANDLILTILPIAGFTTIAGSLIWGWVDTKFGSRVACIGCAALAGVTLMIPIIFWTNLPPMMFVFFMLLGGSSQGASANVSPSIVADVFSQKDFAQTFRMIWAGAIAMRTACYPLVGIGADLLGGTRFVYPVFVVLYFLSVVAVLALSKKPIPAPPVKISAHK